MCPGDWTFLLKINTQAAKSRKLNLCLLIWRFSVFEAMCVPSTRCWGQGTAARWEQRQLVENKQQVYVENKDSTMRTKIAARWEPKQQLCVESCACVIRWFCVVWFCVVWYDYIRRCSSDQQKAVRKECTRIVNGITAGCIWTYVLSLQPPPQETTHTYTHTTTHTYTHAYPYTHAHPHTGKRVSQQGHRQ